MAGNVVDSESENKSEVTGKPTENNGKEHSNCANGYLKGMPLPTPIVVTKDGEKIMQNGSACKEQMEKFILEERKPSKAGDGGGQYNGGTWQMCVTLLVLLLANTLNYVDRYTIAGRSL